MYFRHTEISIKLTFQRCKLQVPYHHIPKNDSWNSYIVKDNIKQVVWSSPAVAYWPVAISTSARWPQALDNHLIYIEYIYHATLYLLHFRFSQVRCRHSSWSGRHMVRCFENADRLNY